MMNNFDENYIIELVKKELSKYLTDQGIDIKKEVYFLGDDKTENSVRIAYESALTFLDNNELFTFNSDDTIVRSFEEVYLKDRSKKKEKIDGQPTLFEE